MRTRARLMQIHVDGLRTLQVPRASGYRPPVKRHMPMREMDARTERHRIRALLHDAERGIDVDVLTA